MLGSALTGRSRILHPRLDAVATQFVKPHLMDARVLVFVVNLVAAVASARPIGTGFTGLRADRRAPLRRGERVPHTADPGRDVACRLAAGIEVLMKLALRSHFSTNRELHDRDHDGPGGKPLALFQSGAIALYAAEKSERLIPRDDAARFEMMAWFLTAVTDVAATSTAILHVGWEELDRTPGNLEFFEKRLIALVRVIDARLASKLILWTS